MTAAEIQDQIAQIFQQHLGITAQVTQGLVPATVSPGKLYEAHVLSRVVERLVVDEGYELTLVGGSKIQLKSSPGPINQNYPRIQLRQLGVLMAELWTDVEFLSLSYCQTSSAAITKGCYHELDIVVVEPGQNGRPRCDQVWLGIECKNTGYQKGLLKEILGIRREMSFRNGPVQTRFSAWPRPTVPADPPSCLLVYSTDPDVGDYAAPGDFFGIDFIYEPM
jgi:hypothetical protein